VSDLEQYFSRNTGRQIHKWMHYFEIYERHFSRFRGTRVHLVEFGVDQGGSLQMWKHYFGPECRIFGVDINPQCRQAEEERIEILIGDQGDRQFLRSLKTRIPQIDILIDDGGHTMKQQIATYEELFPHVDANGVYVCEDLHTSYWPDWGGGLQKRGTFVEYSKRFIDELHGWHFRRRGRAAITALTRTAHSLHYYDSVLVIEKRPIEQPRRQQTGTAAIPQWSPPESAVKRFRKEMKRKAKRWLGRST
jgi:hypothetical protein